MSFIHGKNALITAHDSAGTQRDLSGDTNSATWTWSRDNPDTTTFGKDSIQRIAGLRDATLNFAGIWNSGTGVVDAVLSGIMAASLNTLVRYAPANVSGCPLFAACMLLQSYEVSAPVNGVVAFTGAFQLSSGSVSASTV